MITSWLLSSEPTSTPRRCEATSCARPSAPWPYRGNPAAVHHEVAVVAARIHDHSSCGFSTGRDAEGRIAHGEQTGSQADPQSNREQANAVAPGFFASRRRASAGRGSIRWVT